jgi:polar amino acid transport system substrate-binding protein
MLFPERIAVFSRGLALTAILACPALCGAAGARPLDSIRSRGILSVCANPNALPFSSKSGDRRGFELELGEALANRLGVKLEVA